MTDERREIVLYKDSINNKDGNDLAPGRPSSSGRQPIDNDRNVVRDHDEMRHIHSLTEPWSNANESDNHLRDLSRMLLRAITASNLRARPDQPESPLDHAVSSTPQSQHSHTARYYQDFSNDDSRTCNMARSSLSSRLTQELEEDDSNMFSPSTHQRVFNNTEEEELYLENFQRHTGIQLDVVDEDIPQSSVGMQHHDNDSTSRRKLPQSTPVTTYEQTAPRLRVPPSPLPIPARQVASTGRGSAHGELPFSNPDSPSIRPRGLAAPSLQPPPANINHTVALAIQHVLENVTSIDLSQPRLTNRCRGMGYVPFRTQEGLSQLRSDHVGRVQPLASRLRSTIARRLGAIDTNDPRISAVGRNLYSRAIHALRSLFPGEDQHFQQLEGLSQIPAQLVLLNRLLQRLDLNIRPNGPVHLQNSLAAWLVAAMKWQIDIHEQWIAELESRKKRKRSDGDRADGNGRVNNTVRQQGDGLSKDKTTPVRKPGRPPGSLNKNTTTTQSDQVAKKQNGRKRQRTVLPPLSTHQVHLAHASAAHFAERNRDLTIRALSLAQSQHQAQQPQQQQQRSHLGHQLPPPISFYHSSTNSNPFHNPANASTLHPGPAHQAQLTPLFTHDQQNPQPLSLLSPFSEIRSNFSHQHLSPNQPQSFDQAAVHPSLWTMQRPQPDSRFQVQSQTRSHPALPPIDPAILNLSGSSNSQAKNQGLGINMGHTSASAMDLETDMDTDGDVDVHVDRDDLWNEEGEACGSGG